jgi:hypothetical protein
MIPLELWYSHEQTEGDIARTHDELDTVLNRIAVLARSDWPAAETGLRPTCVPWQTWERPDATTDSEWPDLD